MSHTVASPAAPVPARDRREERKVIAGTVVGTTIEWYDFFIFAQATALVFAALFFQPMGESGSQIAAWATLGISFLIRPLGAIVAGHLGDRFGRKFVLSLTLIGMGLATTLIGLLPTYAQIGVWAPILLVALRLLQGLSAGGEWGGAALLSVEHAPHGKRGLFGSAPQIGVPLGMILATGVLFIVRSTMSEEQFLTWGWRIPFLISVVLIVVGYLIRKAVEESPVFKEMQQLKKDESAPLGELFRGHTKSVILAALIIGLIYGSVGLVSGFCMMSGLRGWWAEGDGRLVRTYALAMGIAIAASQLLAAAGLVDLGKSIYLQPSFSAPVISLSCAAK